MNEDFLYVVKKSLIIDEWKKRRLQNEKENRMASKNKNSNLGSMMAQSFKKQLNKQNSNINIRQIKASNSKADSIDNS